ncbi:PREDICTED: uncharacterized protein LOC106146764 [Chinchilla lanigera]|uniref:uncharacterized protein LOC106146764 n=1 Tax=Chinchilla lanigera TaxID=34839 RepID=UPI0006969511|nr:PREDICTED: uncharacterized protein LOC106146764 [Chinchilla lanigera]
MRPTPRSGDRGKNNLLLLSFWLWRQDLTVLFKLAWNSQSSCCLSRPHAALNCRMTEGSVCDARCGPKRSLQVLAGARRPRGGRRPGLSPQPLFWRERPRRPTRSPMPAPRPGASRPHGSRGRRLRVLSGMGSPSSFARAVERRRLGLLLWRRSASPRRGLALLRGPAAAASLGAAAAVTATGSAPGGVGLPPHRAARRSRFPTTARPSRYPPRSPAPLLSTSFKLPAAQSQSQRGGPSSGESAGCKERLARAPDFRFRPVRAPATLNKVLLEHSRACTYRLPVAVLLQWWT